MPRFARNDAPQRVGRFARNDVPQWVGSAPLTPVLPFLEGCGYGQFGALAVDGDELLQAADLGLGFARHGLTAGLLFQSGQRLAGFVHLLHRFKRGQLVLGGLLEGEHAPAIVLGVAQPFLDLAHGR